MPDSYVPSSIGFEHCRPPTLADRFLTPKGFVWGSFSTPDGARLRWGHLAAENARAECILVGGYGDFIEKQFETIRDLAARGLSVWCLDWRGQGGSTRPKRLPHRPRARRFSRDANELAQFARERLMAGRPHVLIAHSMGGAIALLCLHRHPDLFDAAILSAPMLGVPIGRTPPVLLRALTGPVRLSGLGICHLPGVYRYHPDRPPTPERSRISSDAERCRIRHAWISSNPALRLDQPTYGWLDPALSLIARIGKRRFLAGIKTPILLGECRPGERVVAPAAHYPRRPAPAGLHARRAARGQSTSRSSNATRSAANGSTGLTAFLTERLGLSSSSLAAVS